MSRYATLTRGMTLLEIMVSVSITTLLVTMALEITAMTTRSAGEQMTRATVEVKGERTLKAVIEALDESANLSIDTDADPKPWARITYGVPIDLDGNGTILEQAAGSPLEYGVQTAYGEGSGEMEFEFIAERVIDESVEDVDVNGDGDKNDSFDMGYMQRSSNMTGDTPQIMGVNNIIQRSGDYGGSVVSDNDPADLTGRIFDLPTGSRVMRLNMWLLAISEDRFPHLILCQGQIFLRNQ